MTGWLWWVGLAFATGTTETTEAQPHEDVPTTPPVAQEVPEETKEPQPNQQVANGTTTQAEPKFSYELAVDSFRSLNLQSQGRRRIGRVESLRERYVTVRVRCVDGEGKPKGNGSCKWDKFPGAHVDLSVAGSADVIGSAVLQPNVQPPKWVRLTSLHDIASKLQPDRLEALAKGDLGEAATFNIAVRAAVKGTTTEPTLNTSVLAGRDHSYFTMSVISSPGRFMGAFQRCQRLAGTIDRVPAACEDETRRGSVAATASASVLGAKIYAAPLLRYPWMGFSASVRAASLGASSLFASAQTESTEPTSTLFFSPVDVSLGLFDLRTPAPARFDITPEVGMAAVTQGGLLRAAPFVGVSISTPLIDIRGSSFDRKGSPEARQPSDPAHEALRDAIEEAAKQQKLVKERVKLDGSTWDDGDVKAVRELERDVTAANGLLEVHSDAALTHKLRVRELEVLTEAHLKDLKMRRDAVCRAKGDAAPDEPQKALWGCP